jgi:lactate dehydrogenase-like 2-hydroxyacid dehydrogenase
MNIAVITPIRHIKDALNILQNKGNIFLLETGSKQEVRDLLLNKSIDVILCNPNQQSYIIDKELLINTNVKLINTCSTGLNHIDIEYCLRNDIEIYSLKNDFELLNTLPSTAELAFGLLLDLMRNITNSNNITKSNKVWDYIPFVGHQLKDFNVGIIGYGRLGKMMAHYCKSFGSNVYIYDPYSNKSNVKSLDDLFSICDAISLHVHVTENTKYMIDYNLLCKNVKYLINTSRGEIVIESDVIKALQENKLLGYAADVIEHEFEDISKSPLFNLENSKLNYILTPHVGGMTLEGQTKAYIWAINKFK